MPSFDRERLIRRYFQILDERTFEDFADLLTEDFAFRDPNSVVHGRREFIHYSHELAKLFPDSRREVKYVLPGQPSVARTCFVSTHLVLTVSGRILARPVRVNMMIEFYFERSRISSVCRLYSRDALATDAETVLEQRHG